MQKDTFEDCQACINGVSAHLDGYSLEIAKVVLLCLLRDTLLKEAGSEAMLRDRADQVADFIKTAHLDGYTADA